VDYFSHHILQNTAGTGFSNRTGWAYSQSENHIIQNMTGNITDGKCNSQFRNPKKGKNHQADPTEGSETSLNFKQIFRVANLLPAVDESRQQVRRDNPDNGRTETSHIRALLVSATIRLKVTHCTVKRNECQRQ
jgi:hypothetical protein